MKRLAIVIISLTVTFLCYSQQTITLTFTAIDSTSYVQLDSIKVINRTQDCDTTIHWSDTVLVLTIPVGLSDIFSKNKGFTIQAYPNPVLDQSKIKLTLPNEGFTTLTVTDVLGKSICAIDKELEAGSHEFKIIPGNASIYFISAIWNGHRKTIKLVNKSSNVGSQCSVSYLGHNAAPATEKASKALQGFNFEIGDELLYVGYVDQLESGLLSVPNTSQLYTFQFAYNIPCIGTPTVNYEGQIYNTVQIFSQCWLKENLNVGTMIIGDSNMADNGVVEKYCYNNEPDSCSKYGGLYQWNEMMQYTTQQETKGICPQGWHLPTDEEWKVLEGAVDSQFNIGEDIWDDDGLRGYDAGMNMKTTSGWYENGNGTDLFGFSGLPCGGRINYGNIFLDIRISGLWWSSTENENSSAWGRYLVNYSPEAIRDGSVGYNHKDYGFSVRCIKD